MYRLDSHIHCQYSPDSSTKIDDIIKKSIEDKIDIIAISDHNTVEGSKVAVEKTKNTEKKCKRIEMFKAPRLPKATGIEFKFNLRSNSSSCNA